MVFKTEQEEFWAGTFGTEYTKRNRGEKLLAANVSFFAQALARAHSLSSCIEFGANIGINLRALRTLYPGQCQYAIEINPVAVAELETVIPADNVFKTSILNFTPDRTFDLVLIKGVLIHLDPTVLPEVYELLYRATGRYILLCEYFNPTPVQVSYRGHVDRLFKRDFCGDILDKYSDLRLNDYGFVYHRDPNFPQDDVTWFLMEKVEQC